MKWDEFVKTVEKLQVIDSKILYIGNKYQNCFQVQISRWKKSGKLIQLKKGIYILAKPYRKTELYEPYIASVLKNPSYVSLEKSLEYHNLVPEAVPVYTCVTTKRPDKVISEVGTFAYKHINPSIFWGYNSITVNKQTGFIASPEKALLDLFYLRQENISMDFINELRLQNLEKINIDILFKYARQFKKPKILSAAEKLGKYIIDNKRGEKML